MVYPDYACYDSLSDIELVELLITIPPIQSLHYYFFRVKCASFLQYIAKNIMQADSAEQILGEFYELLSNNDWYVLRRFKGINNASLSTYLSSCAIHHFSRLKKQEDKQMETNAFYGEVVQQLEGLMAEEEEIVKLPVWSAFLRLNERDRKLLYYLVIKGRSAIEVADKIWCYVRSKEKNWRNLPAKRVQSTIAMLKKRALFELLEKLNEVKN